MYKSLSEGQCATSLQKQTQRLGGVRVLPHGWAQRPGHVATTGPPARAYRGEASSRLVEVGAVGGAVGGSGSWTPTGWAGQGDCGLPGRRAGAETYAAMALVLGTLRLLLGVFFALTGAAKLLQVSAPVSQQMVSGAAGARGEGRECSVPAGCLPPGARAPRPSLEFSAPSPGGRRRDLDFWPSMLSPGQVRAGEMMGPGGPGG